MEPQRGYYSLIQFCPDASRMEVVNVGVVLFCPVLDFLDVRISKNTKRAEKLVGRYHIQRKALKAANEAIESRFEVDRESFQTIKDLEKFIDTRGNWLRLTQARPMKVIDPKPELEKLFTELVDEKALPSETKVLFPKLDNAFSKLQSEGRARLNLNVPVPVLDRSLQVPYAYQNGYLNLVKPQRFSHQESSSINSAMRLAIEGDLVNRHGTDQNQKTQLIIVSSFDDEENTDLIEIINNLFHEYNVENKTKDQIAEFVMEIELEAHQNLTDSRED